MSVLKTVKLTFGNDEVQVPLHNPSMAVRDRFEEIKEQQMDAADALDNDPRFADLMSAISELGKQAKTDSDGNPLPERTLNNLLTENPKMLRLYQKKRAAIKRMEIQFNILYAKAIINERQLTTDRKSLVAQEWDGDFWSVQDAEELGPAVDSFREFYKI